MDVDSPNSLKRCSSAPQINNLLPTSAVGVHPIVPMEEGQSHQPEDNQSVAQVNQIKPGPLLQHGGQHHQQSLANPQLHSMSSSSTSSLSQTAVGAPHRESPPTSFSNIFAPRVRRFSASFSPLAVISNGSSSPNRSGSCTPGPRLTPRISQLRQEECADLNSREVNHEREIHSAMQMSQSYEDLTLVTENWSFSSANTKHNDDLINPLHVALPSIGTTYCSSPSPTSRAGLGLQYPTTSPSPTRKYVTRRSMSPCPIRPSPLSSVKRKFDLESGGGNGEGGNCYSPPPLKKIFTNADRGTSPICQTPSPSPICPSPDSSTASFENGSNNASSCSGRITPKFFVTRLSSSASSGGNQLFAGNGAGAGPPPLNPQLVPQQPQQQHQVVGSAGIGATESPPSSSSSSSFMMMDCGVSSSSGGGGIGLDKKEGGTSAVSSSGEGDEGKIDCDEDITDLNVIGSSTSMATTESSEAAMEEVIKTTKALEDSELLDSSSSVVSNCHRLGGSGSVGNVSSIENNNSVDVGASNLSSSSLCPLATNGASASSFMATNIEIAET